MCVEAEISRLIPGELAAKELAVASPKELDFLGSFGEGEQATRHKLRRKNFEEIEVSLLVDHCDSAGNIYAVDEFLPFLVLGTRDVFRGTQARQERRNIFGHGGAPFRIRER
jgi:hypothetical protein